jgi:hypothetical protein
MSYGQGYVLQGIDVRLLKFQSILRSEPRIGEGNDSGNIFNFARRHWIDEKSIEVRILKILSNNLQKMH